MTRVISSAQTTAAARLKASTGRLLCGVGLAVVLGACASKGEPPTGQLATARATITQAEGSGAAQYAPLELASSRDKLTKAEVAVKDENYMRARELAEQSQADAELADRKARAAKAQAAANDMARANQQLSNEAQRKAQ